MRGLVDLKNIMELSAGCRGLIMDRARMTVFEFQQNPEAFAKNESEINVQL